MTPRIAFVLVASDQGCMIVNRFDQHDNGERIYGVGWEIMHKGSHSLGEVEICCNLLRLRRQGHGDGVFAIDCGANVGSHTVPMAKAMMGADQEPDWGEVLAIEAQQRLFYALCGNIALNNSFNARAVWAGVSYEGGVMEMPVPNYRTPGSFGSLELLPHPNGNEDLGQHINNKEPLPLIAIDALPISRLDFLKLDVEGMEMNALMGAATIISTCHPMILLEWTKSDAQAINDWLVERGYKVFAAGPNLLAIHQEDPCYPNVRIEQAPD